MAADFWIWIAIALAEFAIFVALAEWLTARDQRHEREAHRRCLEAVDRWVDRQRRD